MKKIFNLNSKKKILNMPPKLNHSKLRIGIDVGGVLIHMGALYEDNNQEFKVDFNMKGCVKALKELSSIGHTLVLVSFCGRNRAKATYSMISEKYPGLFDEMYFVKNIRYKHDVAVARGLDVMIDDRLDVLQLMSTVERWHFISDVADDKRDPNGREYSNWDDVLKDVYTNRIKPMEKNLNNVKANLLYLQK
jgi:hypothetical protein